MNVIEKQQIEAALETAYNETLKEQDIHRDRIAVMEKIGNKEYLNTLPAMGWDGVTELMVDETFPPYHEDRKKHLDQHWDEIPSRIKIEQIEDFDIRSRTYFLGEVVEQCQRIKAMAKFFEILSANPDDPYARMLYNYWVSHNVASCFADELQETSNQEKAKSKLQLANAYKEVFIIFAENTALSEKAAPKDYDSSEIDRLIEVIE